jgi:hypothetical protein
VRQLAHPVRVGDALEVRGDPRDHRVAPSAGLGLERVALVPRAEVVDRRV